MRLLKYAETSFERACSLVNADAHPPEEDQNGWDFLRHPEDVFGQVLIGVFSSGGVFDPPGVYLWIAEEPVCSEVKK